MSKNSSRCLQPAELKVEQIDNKNFDYLWNLDEVAEFLKGEYETRELVW